MKCQFTKDRHAALALIKQYRPVVDYSAHVGRDVWQRAAVRAQRQESLYEPRQRR